MDSIYNQIDRLIDESIIKLLDNIDIDDKFKVNFEFVTMNMLVEKANNLGWKKVSDLDKNGWDSDYFINYYIPDKKAFVLVSASGYYGTGYITKISEEEVIDGASDDDLDEIEDLSIFSDEAQEKLADIKAKIEENDLKMSRLSDELLNRLREVERNLEE